MSAFKVATFLLIAACCVSCQDSDVRPKNETTTENPKDELEKSANQNETLLIGPQQNDSGANSTESSSVSPVILTDINGNPLMNSSANNSLKFDYTGLERLNSSQKGEPEKENGTSNEFKPFLLFPTLPFLFPGKEGDSNKANADGLGPDKGDEPKPFLFFKFSVNIREIPLNNDSNPLNDSKIIHVRKLDSNETPSGESVKNEAENIGRKRRNTQKIKESTKFFDDFPLFPDNDIDEFFPKPDLFFPDLLLHRKPMRKLSRKKRDMKKPDVKNDLKFFMDLFDEAFAKTKRDLEQANPILEFLRAGNEDNRKGDGDIFRDKDSGIGESSGKKNNLMRFTRENVNNRDEGLTKMAREEENPIILVDKIVKISEMNLPEAREDEKLRSKKKKKRDISDTKKRHRRNNDGSENESRQETNVKHSRKNLEVTKRDRAKETSNVKSDHETTSNDKQIIQHKVQMTNDLGGIKNETDKNLVPAKANETENHEKPDPGKVPVVNLIRKVVNSTENILNFAGDMIKVMDSLESKFKEKLAEEKTVVKRENGEGFLVSGPENLSYADVEKNITRILNEFMMFFKNLDTVKFDMNDVNSFDWTENETLLNSNNILGKRSKKKADYTVEYVEKEKNEKQVPEHNFLFLTVTLPTIIIFALLLLVCFFSLQVRGNVCTKLFKPRRVLVIEDETPSLSPIASHQGGKKPDKLKTVHQY